MHHGKSSVEKMFSEIENCETLKSVQVLTVRYRHTHWDGQHATERAVMSQLERKAKELTWN